MMSRTFCYAMYKRLKDKARQAKNPIDRRKYEAQARNYWTKGATATR